MNNSSPAGVFSTFKHNPDNNRLNADTASLNNFTSHEIRLTATGEVVCKPDRCSLIVNVTSKKDSPNEAKNSGARRVDYIIQALHNHQIKESCVEQHVTLTRDKAQFLATTEIHVDFDDVNKCQSVANVIVEKLDESVTVETPVVYHSTTALDNARRQASLLAVHNAKLKAREMAKVISQSVGRTLSMQESATKTKGETTPNTTQGKTISVQQQVRNRTLTIETTVNAVFELKLTKPHKRTPFDNF